MTKLPGFDFQVHQGDKLLYDGRELFGLEYLANAKSRKWRRASLTMHDRKAIERNGAELAKQEGWFGWSVVEIA